MPPGRISVTLFPFLNVLLCLMGVLAALAVVLSLLQRPQLSTLTALRPIEIELVGAPAHVRPQRIFCRNDVLSMALPAEDSQRAFTKAQLRIEVDLVKDVIQQIFSRGQGIPSRAELHIIFRALLQGGYGSPLQTGFTGILQRIENNNQAQSTKAEQISRYPLFLVYPDGVQICDQALYLMEMTTNLSSGLEPMLPGWETGFRAQLR